MLYNYGLVDNEFKNSLHGGDNTKQCIHTGLFHSLRWTLSRRNRYPPSTYSMPFTRRDTFLILRYFIGPLFYELCAELVYPVPEATSGGLMVLIYNASSVGTVYPPYPPTQPVSLIILVVVVGDGCSVPLCNSFD